MLPRTMRTEPLRTLEWLALAGVLACLGWLLLDAWASSLLSLATAGG